MNLWNHFGDKIFLKNRIARRKRNTPNYTFMLYIGSNTRSCVLQNRDSRSYIAGIAVTEENEKQEFPAGGRRWWKGILYIEEEARRRSAAVVPGLRVKQADLANQRSFHDLFFSFYLLKDFPLLFLCVFIHVYITNFSWLDQGAQLTERSTFIVS